MADTKSRPPKRATKPRLAGGKVKSDNLKPAALDPERPFPTGRGVLTADEIEALLRPDLPEPPRAPVTRPRDVPDLTPVDEPRLSQEMAERLTARMGLTVHQATGLGLAFDVLETRQTAMRVALPVPETGAAYACFASADGDVAAVLCLSAFAASTLVDASCGASAATLKSVRPRLLTEIDTALLGRALAPLASLLPGTTLQCLESRAAFTLSILPPGEGIVLDLSLRLDTVSACASLVLADHMAEQLVGRLGPSKADPATPISGERRGELTALLTARIASLSVPVSRLANLTPGDTLLLGLPADEPVQLLSGGRDGLVAAEGEVGRKGKRMAVRIRRRGPALR